MMANAFTLFGKKSIVQNVQRTPSGHPPTIELRKMTRELLSLREGIAIPEFVATSME